MESLPNGAVVDDNGNGTYKFYYKPIQYNSAKKVTRKQQKYKCYLLIHILKSKHIHIQDFDCKGRGQGDGKILLCAALNYLKSTLELDDAQISLTAISIAEKNISQRIAQDKLVDYYKRTYGFEIIKEVQVLDMYRTDMSTTLTNALDKCSLKQNKSFSQKMRNWAKSLKVGLRLR